MIKMYATKIEAYDEETEELLFIVEACDEACCTVTISTTVDPASWYGISTDIHRAIILAVTGI